MSQSGLLSEDEIRKFINDNYSLNIDRESLLRPTKDVVLDIYPRFLDDIRSKWRKTDEEEPNVKALMLGTLKFIFAHYVLEYIFTMSDLLAPTRKRNTAFLNVLIYIKAQIEEEWPMLQQRVEEWEASREHAQSINQDLAKRRLLRDELAIRKSSLKPLEELMKEYREKNSIFEAMNEQNMKLGAEAENIKIKIQSVVEMKDEKQIEFEFLHKEDIKLEKTLKLLHSGSEIKSEVANLQLTIQDTTKKIDVTNTECQKADNKVNKIEGLIIDNELIIKDLAKRLEDINEMFEKTEEEEDKLVSQIKQAETKAAELQADIDKLKGDFSQSNLTKLQRENQLLVKKKQLLNELDELTRKIVGEAQRQKDTIDELSMKIKSIEKEKARAVEEAGDLSKQYDTYLKMASKQLEEMKKHYLDSKNSIKEKVSLIKDYRKQVESLIGKPKEIEIPANRTYIKEKSVK